MSFQLLVGGTLGPPTSDPSLRKSWLRHWVTLAGSDPTVTFSTLDDPQKIMPQIVPLVKHVAERLVHCTREWLAEARLYSSLGVTL